jgi:hypothetical protein
MKPVNASARPQITRMLLAKQHGTHRNGRDQQMMMIGDG